ncbi:hypothetical protein ACH4E7_35765 [Kitasatospora sp. NPDC018058]|uniref:hypothetical protein n=1 Tax=Kitasatospora sp. NPDC018058 TaxID=3364025 RepID=UPI0037BF2D14
MPSPAQPGLGGETAPDRSAREVDDVRNVPPVILALAGDGDHRNGGINVAAAPRDVGLFDLVVVIGAPVLVGSRGSQEALDGEAAQLDAVGVGHLVGALSDRGQGVLGDHPPVGGIHDQPAVSAVAPVQHGVRPKDPYVRTIQ